MEVEVGVWEGAYQNPEPAGCAGGICRKLLLTGGERAILVEQRAESAEEKPLDWQNGCEKWELIQTL